VDRSAQAFVSGQNLELVQQVEETVKQSGVEPHIVRHGPLRGGGGSAPGLGEQFYSFTVDDLLEDRNREIDRQDPGIQLSMGDSAELTPFAWLPETFLRIFGIFLFRRGPVFTSRIAIARAAVSSIQLSNVPQDFSVLSPRRSEENAQEDNRLRSLASWLRDKLGSTKQRKAAS